MNSRLSDPVFQSFFLSLAVPGLGRILAKSVNSLRPIFPDSFSSVVLTWLLASGALAAGHPQGGDGHGLSIKLEIPWTTFNVGETFVFRYTLQNASDKPVPIAIPIEKYRLRAMTGGQAFLEGFRTGGRKVENPTYDIGEAKWPPRTEVDEEPQAWTWLPPGHQLTWNQNQIWAGHYGVGCYQSFDGFRAHWLTGPGQWISSDPIKVEIVSVPQPEWTEIFKVQWTSSDYRGGPQEGTVYRIAIKEKKYLFFNGPFRITEVEPDDQFEYSIDQDGTNLEITIKGATGSRKVYFHLAQGYTRDTPWPVGPVSIFDPKPEPIPPDELEALQKSMDTAEKPVEGQDPPATDAGTRDDEGAGPGSFRWIWLLAALLIGIAFAMRIVLRLRKSIES